MSDLYHAIYRGEIFANSQCIWHENTLLDFFRSQLLSLGYHSVSDSNKVWARGNQKVVVCLVDDFSTCSDNYSKTLPYLFDSNTTVITDNYIAVPTQYNVIQLPSSFFGIYTHRPEHKQWQPKRRFNFSVNRLDAKRMLMMLELAMRSEHHPPDLDYVNFNCWSWGGDNDSDAGLKANFERQYQELETQYHEVYDDTYQRLTSAMPLRNHSLSHEQSHVSAWMNIVMETYSSDTTVALSEKIFRAMSLPVPWQVYAGRYTVAYLHSLGFDTLQDLMPHRYDNQIENRTAAYGDKMVDFLFEATEAVERMQAMDQQELSERLQSAASTNQRLLAQYRQDWPQDFAAWWPAALEYIR